MSTTFSIRLDNKLKDNFLKNTRSRWLDGWTILRYFITIYNKNPNIIQFWIDEDNWNNIIKEINNAPVYETWDDKTIYYENENNFWIYNADWIDTDKIISLIDKNAW
jgi:hypothetical protein